MAEMSNVSLDAPRTWSFLSNQEVSHGVVGTGGIGCTYKVTCHMLVTNG